MIWHINCFYHYNDEMQMANGSRIGKANKSYFLCILRLFAAISKLNRQKLKGGES